MKTKLKTKKRKIFRIALWCMTLSIGLVFLLTAATLIILAHLDAPSIRSYVKQYIQDTYHLQMDYESLSIHPFSGLALDDLKILTPDAYRKHAPTFFSVDHLELSWDFWSLFSKRLRIESGKIKGLKACIVSDDQGGSSIGKAFSAFTSADPKTQQEKTPVSKRFDLQSLPIAIDDFSLEECSFEHIQIHNADVVGRTLFSGLNLNAMLLPKDRETSLRIELTSPKEPGSRYQQLEYTPSGPVIKEMVFHLDTLIVAENTNTLNLRLSLDLIRQDLIKSMPTSGRLLHMQADLKTQPDQGSIRFEIDRLDLGPEAITSNLILSVQDGPNGAILPTIDQMTGDINLDNLLKIIPLKIEGVMIQGAKASYRIDNLKLDLDRDDLSFDRIAFNLNIDHFKSLKKLQKLDLQDVAISLDGQAGRLNHMKMQAELNAKRIELQHESIVSKISDLAMRLHLDKPDSSLSRLEKATIHLSLPALSFASNRRSKTTLAGSIQNTLLDFSMKHLTIHRKNPIQSTGDLELTSRIGNASLKTASKKLTTRQAGLSVKTHINLSDPLAVQLSIPVELLSVVDRLSGKTVLELRKSMLGMKHSKIIINPNNPTASSATLAFSASSDFARFTTTDRTFSAPKLDLKLELDGSRQKLHTDARLACSGIRWGGYASDAGLTIDLNAKADLKQPAFTLDCKLQGPQGPTVQAALSARYRAPQRNIIFDTQLEARNLGGLRSFIPVATQKQKDLNLHPLKVSLIGKGEIQGVLRGFRSGFQPVFADNIIEAVTGKQQLTLRIEGVSHQSKQINLTIPNLIAELQASQDKGAVRAGLNLKSDRVTYLTQSNQVDLKGISKNLTITSDGPMDQSRLEIDFNADIQELTQNFAPGYPIRQARLSASGEIDRLTAVRIKKIAFDNPDGGTLLQFQIAMDRPSAPQTRDLGPKGIDNIPGRQALAVYGSLKQDLQRIGAMTETFRSSGEINIPFQIESGDLSVYRLSMRLQADNVHLTLPKHGIDVSGLSADIPVMEEIALQDAGGVRLLAGPTKNIYSRTRFFDSHPFLSGNNYLSIQKLAAFGQSFGPLAGNLRIHRDMFTLDQLQMGYRSGIVSGQLVLDYEQGNPQIFFKGNLTGIRPSESDDVLDANATLHFAPNNLDLQGRIQVIRIGKQHLLDLLDFLDPYHENLNFNRARLGLKFGYPEFLRLRMQDGFLAVKISLGGTAGIVRIDEIKNISLGPLLDRYVAPYLRKEDDQ